MEERQKDAGPPEQGPSDATWWPSGFVEKLRSVSLDQEESLSRVESTSDAEQTTQTASQILWTTGVFSGRIPNGFYSVIPEKKLKELFYRIPSPDELNALGLDGLRADIILVDTDKDKKLSMLQQLIVALVKGLNSNPAAVIKKIAALVSDVYKKPTSELSPAKGGPDETSHASETRGIQLLGQIKHSSCRSRGILFKVLADTVGLQSRLVVGLPSDGGIELADSYKHVSVIVVLNSVELLVDLMRFPGQLVPCSSRVIFMSHISAFGESDSAENDSCDSPLEPNSPLCGVSDRADMDSPEHEETLQSLSYRQRREAPSTLSGPPLRNITLRQESSTDGSISVSSSHSEPNIANVFWRRSRRKAIAEQRTASSSPEHPLFRARGRSMLSGHRQSFREYPDEMAPSRSDGVPNPENRRLRRRSMSITPEIGDDIVRAVRAMNKTLKQNRLLKNHDDDDDESHLNQGNDASCSRDNHDEKSAAFSLLKKEINSKKAVSLPSSPHEFRDQSSDRNRPSNFAGSPEMAKTLNKVLDSSALDKALLPFQEWNIDFSELTVGTRVGIGFFGEVFRGVWNGTDVAIKVFLEQDLTTEHIEDFCNEISILCRLRHPNVILFLGACMKPPQLSMVTEYMEMGSLYYLIHTSGQKKKISWRKRLKMLCDICRGLMCIHRMKIVHRDLKSANCLVNKHWTVKICDFGLSRVIKDALLRDKSSGTPEWMAPELIREEPFSEKSDVFSLGVIMWELCTLNRPWEGQPTQKVVFSVAHEGARLEIPEGPLGKLIADCWAERPEERPRCDEILSRLLDCQHTLC